MLFNIWVVLVGSVVSFYVDLFMVMIYEMGYVMGLDDVIDGIFVMSVVLQLGMCYLLSSQDVVYWLMLQQLVGLMFVVVQEMLCIGSVVGSMFKVLSYFG